MILLVITMMLVKSKQMKSTKTSDFEFFKD